jgi:hypothetical protein
MEAQQQHQHVEGESEGSTLQLEVLRHTLSARESDINQLREFATLEKQAHTDFLEEAKVGSRLCVGKENDIEHAILKRELAAARAEAEKYKTGMVLMKQMATEEYLLGKIQKRFESEAARIVTIVDSSSI